MLTNVHSKQWQLLLKSLIAVPDTAFLKVHVQKQLWKRLFVPLNFTGVFELHSLASYRSEWDSVLLSDVADDQGPAFIKIRNISLPNLEGNESWFLNIPDVLSCNRQKPPHGPHLPQMWLVLHSLNEIFVNVAWALPSSLKPLSSSSTSGTLPLLPKSFH